MPSPLSYSWARSVSLTGENTIDSLLAGTAWGSAWSFKASSTTSASLTYSFISPGESVFASNYSSSNEYQAAYALTDAQQAAVTGALGAWSAVANLTFSQVAESSSNVGDLRFGGYSYMDENSAAWAYYPGSSPSGGDVWIGKHTNQAAPTPGSYDYMTFMHEIGHALGLKHPFSESGSNTAVLPEALDDVRYTLMSYDNRYYNLSHTAYVEPTTPMLLDILAMQRLYGANMQWHSGNDTYSFQPDQVVFQTLWDAGGVDTLDASNQRAGVSLNLNQGEFSQIGVLFYDVARGANINNGLAIAYGAQIENATGSVYADSLIGNDLANALDGRGGADTMRGGLGNDTYFVDNPGDVVVEDRGAGTDTVRASISFALGENFERLVLTGSDNLDGTGNALANVITGNGGSNVLDGGAGVDTLIGGAGNDTYAVENVRDTIIEAAGAGIDSVRAALSWTLGANLENLTLVGSANLNATGNTLANVLYGNTGDNILDGGLGADRMLGGQGDDTYLVDDLHDVVLELAGEGRDLVRSTVSHVLGANVENGQLLGTAGLNLTGNAGDNLLTGNAGNNILKGEGGRDTLMGGLGNDSYYVDSTNDVVIEAAASGTDNVFASASWTLGANLENLSLLGTESIRGTGNALDNRLTGNNGHNVLDGGAGADVLAGAWGNDTYVVDQAGDQVIELAGRGTDTVCASLDWALGANLEILRLVGNANLQGTGNALNNSILGNAGDNALAGGAGNDLLLGGLGTDTLSGGTGADRFVFDLLSELGMGSKRDVITDFKGAEGDRIDLRKIDANLLSAGDDAFTFIKGADFTGAGQLRFANQILSGNVDNTRGSDGKLTADFEIHLVGVSSLDPNHLLA